MSVELEKAFLQKQLADAHAEIASLKQQVAENEGFEIKCEELQEQLDLEKARQEYVKKDIARAQKLVSALEKSAAERKRFRAESEQTWAKLKVVEKVLKLSMGTNPQDRGDEAVGGLRLEIV